MQMTMDQAQRPVFAQAFATRRGSGYVMRSEKRPGYGSGSGQGGRRRKPPKAGWFYILMTLIISVILWPVGMVMLWRKKVRMLPGTKLLISLLTMCLSVFLIVFLLTVHVDNPKFTEYQDKANDWLNKASADIAVAGDAAYKKSVETWGVMREFYSNATQPVMNTLADGLDQGVAAAGKVRAFVEDKLGGKDAPATDDAATTAQPEATLAVSDGLETDGEAVEIHIPENTPDPDTARPITGGLLSADGAVKPGETPEPTATPGADADDGQADANDGEDIVWAALDEAGGAAFATDAPASAGDAATAGPEATGALMAAAEVQEVEPTPAATAEPMTVYVRPAGDAKVYYNELGKLYHMKSTCKRMSDAKPHTLTEAVESGKQHCDECDSPDESLLQEAHVAWVDEDKVFHTSDGCANFKGQYKLMSLNDAVNGGYVACTQCQADIYAIAFAKVDYSSASDEAPAPEAEATAEAREDEDAPEAEVTAEAEEDEDAPEALNEAAAIPEAEAVETAKATDAPEADATVAIETPEPTETPAPTVKATAEAEVAADTPAPTAEAKSATVVPTVTLKPAGEATVYHSSNGRFYHKHRTCKAMSGSDPYKLSEITENYRHCNTCNPPETSLVGQTCLWQDEKGVCHTSDECESFEGDYTLVLRDDALDQHLSACPDCGAAEYLVAGTTLAEG